MRQRLPATAALLAAFFCTACRTDAPGATSGGEETQSLTRNLLTQAPDEGGATRIPEGTDPGIAPPTDKLDIAVLGFDRGSKQAPVRVIEMSDYGCGYCRKFHMETFPALLADFIEPGKVEWKFMPYVTGMFENSLVATEAAECTMEQSSDRFETLNDRLWNEQPTWKGAADPAAILRSWVEGVGADMDRYDSCLSEKRRYQRIAAHTAVARQLGVRGTPTFFVIGYQPIQGAIPTELFEQLLDAAYTRSTQGG